MIWWQILLWIIGIHVAEVVGVLIFLLIRRNNALEKALAEQQQYIDAISIVIENSDQQLKELDRMGAFEADDEVGTFFRNLKEIQSLVNQFKTNQK
jgi:hypothetical protein